MRSVRNARRNPAINSMPTMPPMMLPSAVPPVFSVAPLAPPMDGGRTGFRSCASKLMVLLSEIRRQTFEHVGINQGIIPKKLSGQSQKTPCTYHDYETHKRMSNAGSGVGNFFGIAARRNPFIAGVEDLK